MSLPCFSKETNKMSRRRASSPQAAPHIPTHLSAQSFAFRCSIRISIAMATPTPEGKNPMCISLFF